MRSTWSTPIRSSERSSSARAPSAGALAGLRGQEELGAMGGEERLQAHLGLAVAGGGVDVVDARRHRTSSSVLSARAWLIPPRAAAPKMTRVLRCPVRPNGRRSIMDRTVPLPNPGRVVERVTRVRGRTRTSEVRRMRRWLTRRGGAHRRRDAVLRRRCRGASRRRRQHDVIDTTVVRRWSPRVTPSRCRCSVRRSPSTCPPTRPARSPPSISVRPTASPPSSTGRTTSRSSTTHGTAKVRVEARHGGQSVSARGTTLADISGTGELVG